MTQNEFTQKFEEKMREITQTFKQFPWDDKMFYGNWLAQTYYYVQHSTRLLALSAARFDISQDKQHKRFLMHLREETGHEKMATNDLKHLNLTAHQFPQLHSTASFYQTQYYWIQNVSPITFLGYILALEGMAVYSGPYIHQVVSQVFGKKASVFVSVHCTEDEDHLPKALNLLSELTSTEIDWIYENFCLSCDNYISMLNQVKNSTSNKIIENNLAG